MCDKKEIDEENAFTDFRMLPQPQETVWRYGSCLSCGSSVYETESEAIAPNEAKRPESDPEDWDYYLWCANPNCPHYAGECYPRLHYPTTSEWAKSESVPLEMVLVSELRERGLLK